MKQTRLEKYFFTFSQAYRRVAFSQTEIKRNLFNQILLGVAFFLINRWTLEIHTWNTCIQICYVDTFTYTTRKTPQRIPVVFESKFKAGWRDLGWGTFKDCTKKNTLRKTNMSPKKGRTFNRKYMEIHLPTIHFQGLC